MLPAMAGRLRSRAAALVMVAGVGLAGAAFGPAPAAGAYTAVSAGGEHSCAVRAADGSLVCWGDDQVGQAAAPAGSFRSVSAGALSSCAVRLDGSLACWGSIAARPDLAPAGAFASVSVGVFHSCAVAADGTLSCWGSTDDHGELDAPPGRFTAVSAGYAHTCAIRVDEAVVCWGDDSAGQTDAPAGSFVSVAAGYGHSCAVRSEGTVACWGFAGLGWSPPPAGRFTAVSAGSAHTCARRTDASLACWGSDVYGQAQAPPGSFAAVSAGYIFTCALRSDGSLACWGRNEYGQATPPGADPPPPPTTTIARAPADPDGEDGWYVSGVRLTLSATAHAGGVGVVETRCVLDPPSVPEHFDDLPAGCAYTGAGGSVGDDGEHVLYAASRDSADNEERPTSTRFRIDRTAPTVSCRASPSLLWPRNHKLVAVTTAVSVFDAGSSADGFALASLSVDQPADAGDAPGWTLGAADTDGALRAETSGSTDRTYTLDYRGFDRAGNQAPCETHVVVAANRRSGVSR